MEPKILASESIVAWVGLDWADQQHVLRLQAAAGDPIESLVLPHRSEALQDWVRQLRARFPEGQIAIALEQSRGPLIYALMGHEFLRLYPVPPKSLAKYREAFYPSGSKNDPSDAGLLLDMLRHHRDRLRLWVADDAPTRQLQRLCEYRRKTVDDITRVSNELTSLLKDYFPQALAWAGELASPLACDLLWQWPSLASLQKASRHRLRQFHLEHGWSAGPALEQRLEQIRSAQPLTQDTAVIEAAILRVEILVSQLRCLRLAVERFQQQISQLYGQHPDYPVFDSFPGAGAVLGPRVLVAWGSDRQRYPDATALQQFSGIAPVTQRSGKSCWVHWRLGCPKFLRQTFHEFAGCSIPWCPWAKAYYQLQKSRGLSHHAAVRALAFKWMRIFFRCWKDRTPYNEQIYLDSLKRRGSPLLRFLTASDAPARP